MNKWCETCLHWRKGDLTDRYGNVGTCTFAHPQKGVIESARAAHVVPSAKHVPFWMDGLSFRTSSYDGRNCASWQKGTPKLLAANKS